MLRGGEGKLGVPGLKILGPLGVGGFGAVYEALDERTGQHVAVKRLDDTSADSIARFKHEFRALADCHHENLVGLRELIEQDGRWLIVMELVPGTDFLRYVSGPENDNARRAVPFDETRLRAALIGVVRGLRALHGFGVVHRDLKPSNVRVTPEGRAVLLDFGLATSVDPSKQSTHAMGLGTVVYMAPEQASSERIGPAADMYALGVCLFEALTGQAPFDRGNAVQILLDKQRALPARARSLVPSVPAELDELCARLLAIEPAARPSCEEVLSVLTRTPLARPSLPEQQAAGEPNFAGRETELAHLERALSLTNDGEQRLLLVEGESGVGKSELVSEFLRRMGETRPRFLALRGRCYENEQVSYKAFDGCIDELARFLRRLPANECAALMPERVGLLGQLFPVLRNVPAIADGSREGSSADPSARRLEAFRALSQLLAKLTEERPLVLVLDDLQWADSESFRLLTALREQTPRAPLLLVATVRPRAELEPEVHTRIDTLRAWTETEIISLYGLPHPQAKDLARRLLGEQAPESLLDLIARESQGHPLFMSELVQYTQSHDFARGSALTIDAALRARVDGLERPARALLEMVALAARPYPSKVFAGALSAEIDDPARELLARKLLRQRRGHELGCFHDRIRHAAVSLIARTRLPMLHHQLANALDAWPHADQAEQARHWDLAGEPERASVAYEHAAVKALNALAFVRAAELFGRAVELLATRADERFVTLTARRAEALASAGRSSDAASLFQEAANVAQGEQRIQLRSSMAMHMMLAANVAPGVQVASQLLRELGFSIPANRLAWVARFAWDALCLRFAHVRDHDQASQSERRALTTARPVLRVLGLTEPRLYFGLLMQQARRSAELGLHAESAYALIMRAWLQAIRGAFQGALPLLDQARRLMDGENDPLVIAENACMAASVHQAGHDWAGSVDHLTLAERTAQQHCQQPWLLTLIRYHLGLAWYHGGQHALLLDRTERWIQEARERNDVLGVGLLSTMGCGFLRHLMADAPQAATQELQQIVAALSPRMPYSFVHLGLRRANALVLIYEGGRGALSFVEAHEAEHRGAFLLRSRSIERLSIQHNIGALLSAHVTASETERPALLVQARRCARQLAGGHAQFAASAALANAQIDAIEGRRERALMQAREAARLFRQRKLFFAWSADYLEGVLEGGATGAEKCANALERYRGQGWRNPLRAVTMHAPALALLSAASASDAGARRLLLRGRYEVTGQLGRGGFSSVVCARDVQSGRTVALKELVRKGGMAIERFKQEFRTLAELHHENIVRLEELFEHEGAWYIAMERVQGIDLVSYVRASGRCDPERLRRSALDLSQALAALHQKGFVHRDIKPPNVLVDERGRAVLIDFGLVARVKDERDAGPLGSLEYSAPEQLRGALPDPAADVYALGVTLLEAINGRTPASQAALPAAPELAELASFVQRMLAPEPAARPSLEALVRVLADANEQRPGAPVRIGLDEAGSDSSFAGRERERAWLEQALERTRTAGLQIALVEGESGIGKSALVSHFARGAAAGRTSLVTLGSRCYEHEQVAFKAFDGVVDQLAKLLRSLPRASCEALLPKRAALLAQLFPVLSGVPAVALASKKGLPADPAARKRAGLDCFLELLEKVSAERELLVIIDDLQWADRESFELLHTLARQGAQSQVTLLCTVRPQAELEPQAEAQLASLRALPNCGALALGSLDGGALGALAQALLGDVAPERLGELVQESGGHPLFLRELIEHEKRGGRDRQCPLTLDGALDKRIEELAPQARDVLSLVALADKPHGVHVYAHALNQLDLPRDVAIALLGQGLLQRRGDRLACYHDRIRRAALVRLSAEQRRAAARRLAAALEAAAGDREGAGQADAAERARLWDEAGEPAPAIAAYEVAGDQALEALAFVRAEEHYARAHALLGDDESDASWQRIAVSRGHALVRAGRSAEAAHYFQRAARYAQGENQVRLRVWAAQHLIQSARVDEGMRAARELLAELGITLPASEGAAKRRVVWERLRMKLRGTEFAQRTDREGDRLALEAMHGLHTPLHPVAYLHGAALLTQYLRRALDAGDPQHAARALAFEAYFRILKRSDDPQEELFARAESLAGATGEPALLAEIASLRGLASITRNQLEQSHVHSTRAHELLTTQCPGQPWLLTAVRIRLGVAWLWTRRFEELRSHGERWLHEAHARDDRYAMAALPGAAHVSYRYALQDDPEAGLAEIEAALASWPREPFSWLHVGAFFTSNMLRIAADQGVSHLNVLEQDEPRLARAFMMNSTTTRFFRRKFRVFALLGSITTPKSAGADALIERARADLRHIAKVPGQGALVRFCEAWIRLAQGDREGARRELIAARALTPANPFYLTAQQYVLGKLEGGDAGRALCDRATAQLHAEGWRNIQRGLAACIPVSLAVCDALIGLPDPH